MDIYTYLTNDHRKVARLFKSIIASNTSKERQRLFVDLQRELELHADPEHNTFYQALKESPTGQEEVEHADMEHQSIKNAIRKLNKIPAKETAKWLVQLGELKYIVEHHVEDEESNMFKDGKTIISNNVAEELVVKIKELKEKMMQSKSFKNKFLMVGNKKKNII